MSSELTKITRLIIQPAHTPLERPAKAGTITHHKIGIVAIALESDSGARGEAFAFTLNAQKIRPIVQMFEEIAPLLIGQRLDELSAFAERYSKTNRFFGSEGVEVHCVSTIDSAIWDLKAKVLDSPIHSLIGTKRRQIPTYWSGGFYLSDTIDELEREAELRRTQGWRALKIRIDGQNEDATIERIAAVRRVVGNDLQLMVDANQTLTVPTAVRLSRRICDEGLMISWLEEPVRPDDHNAELKVAERCEIPIATGESLYLPRAFRPLLREAGVGSLMPDLQRVGGISGVLAIAHAANVFGIPISSHLFPEMSLGLIAAMENATWLEYIPWFESFYQETITIKDGFAEVSDRPGHGFSLDWDKIAAFSIA